MGEKGPEAANVTGPDGAVVEGSKYAANISDGRGARGYRRRYYYGNRSGRRGPRATSEGEAQAGEGEGEDVSNLPPFRNFSNNFRNFSEPLNLHFF